MAVGVRRVRCPTVIVLACGEERVWPVVSARRLGVNAGPEHQAAVERLRALCADLRRARRGLRLSQEELAAGLGVSALAVGSWETGKDMPSAGNFVRWADAVGYVVKVEGAALEVVLVPRRGEPFDQFQLRRLMTELAGARERMDWTQEMVGAALGVSAWSVHMWETAHRVPRVLRLVAWCQVVHCRLIVVRRER